MMSEFDLFTPDPEAVKAWVEKHLMPKRAPVLVWRGRHPDVAKGADGKMFTAIEENIQAEHHDKPKASETVTALVLEQRAKDLRKDRERNAFTEIKVGSRVTQPSWKVTYVVTNVDHKAGVINIRTLEGKPIPFDYPFSHMPDLTIVP